MPGANAFPPVVERTRGDLVESVHGAAIAVADTRGRLVAFHGDPHAVAYLRSSAKPFQAVSLIESGAARAYGLSPREIALACASHAGLDLHAEAVAAMQAKIGISEADLRCGTHPVFDEATAERLARAGLAPTPNRHNCSGKHSGMLAQARLLGLPLDDYLAPGNPLQQTILNNLAAICGFNPAEIVVGLDGCSAPNFALPLVHAAAGFARLADPDNLAPGTAEALRQIFAAMTAHPEMVEGPGEFNTELMRTRPGVIVSKGGADGYQAASLAPGALGPGSPALGIALKIRDGAAQVSGWVMAETLRQLGALGDAELGALAKGGHRLPHGLKNWRGLPVGEARACFTLTRP